MPGKSGNCLTFFGRVLYAHSTISSNLSGFVKCSSRLRRALTSHICALLSRGISVVLDFPGNTKTQRLWFREIIERANVEHELHFVDASDALCKGQLAEPKQELTC